MMESSTSTHQKRIAFVGPMLGRNPGRVPDAAEELAARLAGRGYDCLLTSATPNRYARFFDILQTILRRRTEIDIVSLQVYGGPSFVVEDTVSRLARALKKPLVMALQGGALPEFMRRRPAWSRQVLGRAGALVTPSHYLKEFLQGYGFASTVIPNALDLSRYPFKQRERATPRVAWLRAMHAIYSPADAVETAAILAPEFPGLQMAMIGPDMKDGSLEFVKELIEEKELRNTIELVGAIPKADVPARLAHYDILLNTTLFESFGIGVMEAAALGMNIVTTDVGELRYLWQDGVNALLVPVRRPDLLAVAVRRCLTEPELAARLSRNARANAQQYGWDAVLPAWEDLLRKAGEG